MHCPGAEPAQDTMQPGSACHLGEGWHGVHAGICAQRPAHLGEGGGGRGFGGGGRGFGEGGGGRGFGEGLGGGEGRGWGGAWEAGWEAWGWVAESELAARADEGEG